MKIEEAEEIYMAWQVGLEDDKAKIAQALLVLKGEELDKTRS